MLMNEAAGASFRIFLGGGGGRDGLASKASLTGLGGGWGGEL